LEPGQASARECVGHHTGSLVYLILAAPILACQFLACQFLAAAAVRVADIHAVAGRVFLTAARILAVALSAVGLSVARLLAGNRAVRAVENHVGRGIENADRVAPEVPAAGTGADRAIAGLADHGGYTRADPAAHRVGAYRPRLPDRFEPEMRV